MPETNRWKLELGQRAAARPVEVIHFTVDGEPWSAYPGDSVAAALYAYGKRSWRISRSGDARGLLCGMGICFDCLIMIDGTPNIRACQAEVYEGMVVETQACEGKKR